MRTLAHHVTDSISTNHLESHLPNYDPTRPDLSYSVGDISQFKQTPCDTHFHCAKRVLRYASGTLDRGMFYKEGAAILLERYTDVNWTGSVFDRRSTSGFVFSLGSGLISWSSKKQPTIALSRTEAKYRGAAIATCEVIWLKRLLKDFNESVDEPIRIYCDNQSNIQLARNSVFHPRTKHIEVHYCYVREHIIVGDIDIVYICTNLQMVDIFTKTLGTTKLQQFSLALDLRPFNTTSLRHRLEGEEPKLSTGCVKHVNSANNTDFPF